MGTRAVYTFKDDYNEFHVYKHWDGYPSGAAEFLVKTIEKSFGLRRYEADEFAAAFIAANKTEGGDIRLTHHYEDHGDLSYRYELSQARNGQLIVSAYETSDDEPIFYGRLKDFVNQYGDVKIKRLWNTIDDSQNKLVA
jgi:hypothetical protein